MIAHLKITPIYTRTSKCGNAFGKKPKEKKSPQPILACRFVSFPKFWAVCLLRFTPEASPSVGLELVLSACQWLFLRLDPVDMLSYPPEATTSAGLLTPAAGPGCRNEPVPRACGGIPICRFILRPGFSKLGRTYAPPAGPCGPESTFRGMGEDFEWSIP